MIRLALWSMAGLMLGLAVHLLIILAVPHIATRTAFDRLATLARDSGFHPLPPPSPSEQILPMTDPAMSMAVCRFDLRRGPVHVRAPVTGDFFSVSFYTPDGLNFYALSDRAAPEGVIELTLYSSLQLAEVRAKEGPDTPEALRVEAPGDDGLVVVRALAPEPGYVAGIEKVIAEASCAPGTVTSAAPSRLSARDDSVFRVPPQ